MRFESKKNFFTQEECAALNAWVDLATEKKWMDYNAMFDREGVNKRINTRWTKSRFVYPPLVLELRDRVAKYAGIADCDLIVDQGRDGVVVSRVFPTGAVNEHTDGAYPGVAILRCNVVTQAADAGGILEFQGEQKIVDVGELHCYLASEHPHNVSLTSGATDRICWMFGAYVIADDWNSGKIKFGEA